MDKWISTSERLPEPEKEVLALCRTRGGVDYFCVAIYIAPGTTCEVSAISWDYDACKYDEEQGKHFALPGWYEQLKYWGKYAGIVDDVTHWMELPEVPEEGKKWML